MKRPEDRKRPPTRAAFLKGHDVRKPFKYNSAKDLNIAMTEYFDSLAMHTPARRATITGLALFLGFANVRSLTDQKKRSAAFEQIIEIARLTIENGYEEGLWDKNCSNGCKFVLATTFGYVMPNSDSNKKTPPPATIVL